MTDRRPVSASSSIPRRELPPVRIFVISSRMRSALIRAIDCAFFFIAMSVSGSIEKSRLVAKRTARQHPEVILQEPLARAPDCTDDLCFEIRLASHIIHDVPVYEIHQQTVYREITPPDVLFSE